MISYFTLSGRFNWQIHCCVHCEIISFISKWLVVRCQQSVTGMQINLSLYIYETNGVKRFFVERRNSLDCWISIPTLCWIKRNFEKVFLWLILIWIRYEIHFKEINKFDDTITSFVQHKSGFSGFRQQLAILLLLSIETLPNPTQFE